MTKTAQRASRSILIDMDTNQFPFNKHPNWDEDDRKTCLLTKRIFVRKRVYYKSKKQKGELEEKLEILKHICHKNIINIRNIEEVFGDGYIVYYNYVPLAIQNAFDDIDHQTFQDLHKQIIQLAIHLAKNYILTSFNSNRCGIIFVEGKPLIKYYLPLQEITITQNISALQRSVQLFKVQAIHMLDSLRHQNTHSDFSISDESEIYPKLSLKDTEKGQKNSFASYRRRLSNETLKRRRFSSYQQFLKEMKRKNSQDSTYYSQMGITKLKKALNTIKQSSERKRSYARSRQKIKIRVNLIKVRSCKAIKQFESFKRQIEDYMALSRLLTLHKNI